LYIEKDCFEKSHNYCSTGDRTAELNIHLKTLFKQKLSGVSFTDLASIVGPQLLNLRLLKVMLRCINSSVTDMKPGHQTAGNSHVIWSNESSFTLFSYISKRLLLKKFLVPTVKHGGRSLIVWAGIWWYSVCLIITLHGRITVKEYMDRLGNQVPPMIQMLFPNRDIVFQDDNAPIHTPGTVQFSHSMNSMKVNLSMFPGQHSHLIRTSLNHSGQFWRPEQETDSHFQHL
jgi:hypothetical protein